MATKIEEGYRSGGGICRKRWRRISDFGGGGGSGEEGVGVGRGMTRRGGELPDQVILIEFEGIGMAWDGEDEGSGKASTLRSVEDRGSLTVDKGFKTNHGFAEVGEGKI
ncbi:hypothetical protein QJS10_CPA07g00563 [Acorus calamus]|uniref:Uncharacterized protein n=1 Tax=Acorus calamus TaxID=4465 RepID=A0AAV9EG45_ACOCL|nr:hypothetical protein QJS10_CPA07g00563 [Acorus calamus]